MTVALRFRDRTTGKPFYLAEGKETPLARSDDTLGAALWEDEIELWRWVVGLPPEIGAKLDGMPYEVVTVDLDLTGATNEGIESLISWAAKQGRPVKMPAPSNKPGRHKSNNGSRDFTAIS